MAISESGVAYLTPATVLSIGVEDQSVDLLNLGVLGATRPGTDATGTVTTTTLDQPDDGNVLNVGETFTITTTTAPEGETATETTETFTMAGTGTFSGLLGTRTFILAEVQPGGAQRIIFPEGEIPSTLDLVGDAVIVTTSTQAAGYDFTADAIVCFARGTLLATPQGPRAIEDLQVGDLVRTRDHGPQPLRWMGRTTVPARTLAARENLRPIRIRAGALGADTPSTDLVVSPQHRMLVRSGIAQKMFGTMEVLVAAKQLLQIEGVDIAHDLPEVEYFHMLFDQHEVVFANGAESESLHTGPQALKAVGRAALDEIFGLFPQLKEAGYAAEGARLLVSGRHGRKLALRHKQNDRALVQ